MRGWKRLLVYPTANNELRTTRILDVTVESPTVKTFVFKDDQCSRAKPGQFLMLWIPGIDEIPLSIMDVEKDHRVSVAVKKVGEATKALHDKKESEIIGVRGPFGNSFSEKRGRILLVSGGTGTVPILFLAKRLVSRAASVVSVIGAKTRDELLFIEEFRRILDKEEMGVIPTTEDGSYGAKGLVTACLESLMKRRKFDAIYTCGPEQMMRKVFGLAESYGIPLEASLERLMRCAIGVCGSCVVGKYRVCRDGPVFISEQLREISSEFGISRRDFDGGVIPVNSS